MGVLKAPPGMETKPVSTSWPLDQDVNQTPLLYIHRPILDKTFASKHKSGVFTPGRTLFTMGKAILHTNP